MLHAGHHAFPSPSHSKGPLPRKKKKAPLLRKLERWHSTEIGLDAAFSHVTCVRERYQSVIRWSSGFIRGVSFLFQHSSDSITLSHTHTPLWKTNISDENTSIWCKLVRKCSMDLIIISRYVRRRFQQVTKWAACWHPDCYHSTLNLYLRIFEKSLKLTRSYNDAEITPWQIQKKYKTVSRIR